MASLTPLSGRRCPLPSFMGFLMPFLWFLYDWLCAVWLVDLAMVLRAGWEGGLLRGRRRGRCKGSRNARSALGAGRLSSESTHLVLVRVDRRRVKPPAGTSLKKRREKTEI